MSNGDTLRLLQQCYYTCPVLRTAGQAEQNPSTRNKVALSTSLILVTTRMLSGEHEFTCQITSAKALKHNAKAFLDASTQFSTCAHTQFTKKWMLNNLRARSCGGWSLHTRSSHTTRRPDLQAGVVVCCGVGSLIERQASNHNGSWQEEFLGCKQHARL